jgi:hypothetical protein
LPAARRVRAQYFSGQTNENLEIASSYGIRSSRSDKSIPHFLRSPTEFTSTLHTDLVTFGDFQIARKANGALDTYGNFLPPQVRASVALKVL